MTQSILIGVDVGSGSTKVTAFTATGSVLAQAAVAYQYDEPAPGVAEYDPFELREATVEALAMLTRTIDGTQVEAVAIDALMSGAVPLDAAGNPLAAYTTTLDTRFAPDLEDYVHRFGDRARRLSGSDQATLAPKIAWLRRTRPELSERTVAYVMAGSLVGGYLAGLDGAEHYVDPTYLWTTGLGDLAAGTWSPELCAATGIDEAWLPRIVAATDVVGHLTADLAQRCGIRAGVPIVAGCGDASAGFAGAGISRPGVAGDSAGTYASLAVPRTDYVPGVSASSPIVSPAPSNDLFHYLHVVIGGGLTRQWAHHLFAQDHLDRLEAAAADLPPGSEGLIVLPYLGGTASPPDANVRGSILGLNWAHKAPHVYRAVLESIALDHVVSLQFMPAGTRLDAVYSFGGGSRSQLWNQIKSDVFGLPLHVVGDFPVTELGTALIAAQGVGLIDDMPKAVESVRPVTQVLDPHPGRHEQYLVIAERYAGLARIGEDTAKNPPENQESHPG